MPDLSAGMVKKTLMNPLGLDSSTDGVPEFLKPVAANSTTTTRTTPLTALPRLAESVSGEEPIAGVSPLMPHTINVMNPTKYTADPGIRAHELTHELQYKTGLASNPHARAGDNTYDYGGQQELYKSSRPISDFTLEQQAQIVHDAVQNNATAQAHARSGQVNPIGASDYDEMKAAYHPYLRQLLQANTKNIITTPEPPGPPPSALTGVLKPDPLIGGPTVPFQSIPLPRGSRR